MKEKLIFYLCVALLPYIVSIYAADDDPEEGSWQLEAIGPINEMAERGQRINDILRPSKNGYLGAKPFQFTYKGEILKPTTQEVAMRFTPVAVSQLIINEHEILTYLGSLHDPNIESYGIPKVYYFGQWKRYFILAITLVDYDPKITKALRESGKLNDVDILIAFREFLRISKYIHSKGIRHKIIGTEDLLFRRDRAFLVDFPFAHTMQKKNELGEKISLLPNDNAERRKLVRKDSKGFLYSMCYLVGVEMLPESGYEHMSEAEIAYHVEQFERTIPKLLIKKLGEFGLGGVLVKFARFVLEDKIQSSNKNDKKFIYDYFDRITCMAIKNLNPPEPVLVSWLTPAQRNATIHDSNMIPTENISSIPNPKI